jgi:hypothetical protein
MTPKKSLRFDYRKPLSPSRAVRDAVHCTDWLPDPNCWWEEVEQRIDDEKLRQRGVKSTLKVQATLTRKNGIRDLRRRYCTKYERLLLRITRMRQEGFTLEEIARREKLRSAA